MRRQDNLYVFVHIPKTAGESFKNDVESSVHPSHFVRTSFTYQEHYFDIKAKRLKFYEGREYFEKYIGSLNKSQISQIRCIGGHDSYCGIHDLFKRPALYTTFFREPVARTISLYNYERWLYDLLSHKKILNMWENNALKTLKDTFLIDAKIPRFEEWLETTYDQKIPFNYSMIRYLQHLKFIGRKINTETLSEALSKFYFIGITEKREEDSLFLYHQLSVRQFFSNKNATPQYVSLAKLDKGSLEKIKIINGYDTELYEAALKQNELFKRKTKTFYPIIKSMKRKKKFYLYWEKIKNPCKVVLNKAWSSIKLKYKNMLYRS